MWSTLIGRKEAKRSPTYVSGTHHNTDGPYGAPYGESDFAMSLLSSNRPGGSYIGRGEGRITVLT